MSSRIAGMVAPYFGMLVSILQLPYLIDLHRVKLESARISFQEAISHTR